MSYLTLNGAPCLAATITLPRRGAWTADIETLNAPSVSAGDAVTLVLGSQSFVGTVHRVTRFEGRGFDVRIVGGCGGLSLLLPAAQFFQPTIRNVLDSALAASEEALSSTSDLTSLAANLDFWERPERTLGQELDAVARTAGLEWRVLPDGKIFLGTSSWAQASLTAYEVMEHTVDTGKMVLAADDPTVLPGQTIEGLRVSLVIHRVTEEATRTEIYQDDSVDRSLGVLDALIRRSQPTDLHAYYPYQVIAQNADGTFELKAIDSRMPGLSRVRYEPATPGTLYAIASGVCLVGFEGGRETAPYVAAWKLGTPTTMSLPVSSTLHLGAVSGADYVALAGLVEAQLNALKTALSAAVVVTGDGGLSLKTTLLAALSGWPTTTAATKVKAT
jgi:hypothetical protein